jgi:RNA polymerase sigma factor (sigma-70 family)
MNDSNHWSEDKLIVALSKGGALREQAVNYLMNAYIHYIPSVSKKVGLAQDLALDTFTDAIIDLIEQVAKGKFKGESKLSSYFYKIFYFKSIDLFRKNKTNRIAYQEELPELPDSAPIAAKEMEIKEAVNQLYKYLDQLGEPCKQILIDWGFWGYNMTEIAERVGLLGSAEAKDRKYNCLQKLRKLIK